MKFIIGKILLFLLLPVFFLGMPFFAVASTSEGTIDQVYKYAWSTDGGWVNFGCDNCNVQITDGSITGYAWSQNFGWINLNPDQSGIQNNGEGVLTGSAWGEKSGWINFAGVTINSVGQFTGTASDDILGTVNFDCENCTVKTDWLPASQRPLVQEGSFSLDTEEVVNGSSSYVLKPPVEGFGISINHGASKTNNRTVIIYLNGGTAATQVEISNSSVFTGITQAYEQAKNWVLPAGDGKKTVYVKFYGKGGTASQILQSEIILDTTAPNINADQNEYHFEAGQDAILSGTIDDVSQIFLNWGEKSGLVNAKVGQWSINLGKLVPGNQTVRMKAEDDIGNSKIIEVFVVISEKTSIAKKENQIVGKLKEVGDSVMNFFKPKTPVLEIVRIPSETPWVFSGNLALLSSESIKSFALAPLPSDIKDLSAKFPKLAQTFEEVGISKITDISSLKNINLSIPSLGEIVSPSLAEVVPGKFMSGPSLPISEFTTNEIDKIPTGVVFVRSGDGLVDLNAVLSIDNQGQAQQKIKTVAGAPLQLVVKAEENTKSVKAYIVFKSRNANAASVLDLADVATASLSLASTVFAQAQENQIDKKIVLDEINFDNNGNGIFSAQTVVPVSSGEYEILTVIEHEDIKIGNKEIRLINVVDPEGYVYEKTNGKETRINGGIVSIFWLNPNTKEYELWPASEFQQQNPQTTDVRGSYSFLVPAGYYYLSVSAPGYAEYEGRPFQVSNGGGVHMNIELKTKYWWMNIFEWKNILLVLVILLLVYNFYKDKMREVRLSKEKLNLNSN